MNSELLEKLILAGLAIYLYHNLKDTVVDIIDPPPSYSANGRTIWLAHPYGMPDQAQWFTNKNEIPSYYKIAEIREQLE